MERDLGLTWGSCKAGLATWLTRTLPTIPIYPGTQMKDTSGTSSEQVVSMVRMRLTRMWVIAMSRIAVRDASESDKMRLFWVGIGSDRWRIHSRQWNTA